TRNSSGNVRLSGNPEQCAGKPFSAGTVVETTLVKSTRPASGSVRVLTAHRSTPHAAVGVGDGAGAGAGAGAGCGAGEGVGVGADGVGLPPHAKTATNDTNAHTRSNRTASLRQVWSRAQILSEGGDRW